MTPTTRALKYATDVINGKIPNCKWVKLACQRFLDDLKKQHNDDFPYKFDTQKADRFVNFLEKMPHTKGKWAAKKELYKAENWQCFIDCNLFGWVHKETGFRRFRVSFELIPRKNGKALDVNTKILTTKGWKKHGELKEGDYVFSPSGRPVRVNWVSEKYTGPCHEMKFSDGSVIYAHENHEWVTERTWYTGRKVGGGDHGKDLPSVESKEIFRTLRMTGRGDYVHRIKNCASLQFDEKKLPIPPYTLGVWLGDGTSLRSEITTADQEVVNGILAEGIPVTKLKGNGGKAGLYSLFNGDFRTNNGTSIKYLLRKLNLIENKHIPEDYLFGSFQQRLSLLKGLLDTDGCITKRGIVEFTSVNENLAEGVAFLVRSLGMKATCIRYKSKLYGVEKKDKYRVHFTPVKSLSVFTIERKSIRQKPAVPNKKRSESKTIISASPCGDKLVNCIEVEGSLYLAGESLITTHNSFRVAGRGIYLAFADGERGSEVYSGATSEKQAFEVFRPAWQMVDGLPNLKSYFGIQTSGNGKNPGTIFKTEDMSKFEVMIGKPGDGASPHGAIIDEYHEHDSDHMVDTMQTGMGAREQPLLSVITTAGSNLGGPCYEMQQDMQRILEGSVKDETTFAIMYGIDPADSWDSVDSLIKANPNYGISVFPDFLIAQLEQAKRSASKQNAFRTKHLNEWVGAKTAWMNMVEWNKSSRPEMKMEDFKDIPCHLSADLSSKKDITAIDITFKKEENYYSFKKFFVPEMALEENEKYMDFHTAGFLETTPGAMLDQEEVEDFIVEILTDYTVLDCTFDEWNADYMMSRLSKRKIDVVKFPFNVRHVSEPMKTLEALVLDGKYFHDGNPVQTWMMGNVVSFEDKRGNVFPNKARPNDQKCKKDGVDVSIMSIGRYMTEDEPEPEYKIFFV